MSAKISRRNLLAKASQAIAASGLSVYATSAASPASPPRSTKGTDYYQKLGVVPFINAAGTYTILTASTMPDEVQAAVALAAQ